MTIRRVAIIFDNSRRPETTGFYCRRALGQIVDVEHFLPEETERILPGEFDLFLNIDDGLRYPWPERLRPSAYWAIDTHLDFDGAAEKSVHFDFVFAAQKEGAEKLQQAGIESAQWLPLACDPELHGRFDVPQQHDVCFVGNLFPGPRTDLLQQIRERFTNTYVGRRYLLEMAETYSSSRIIYNRSVRNDLNMRVFEALASGSLLITNELTENGQEELFGDGVHLATYRDPDELLEKIAFYLEREAQRTNIAEDGRVEVLARHTYLHRMKKILESVEARERCGTRAVPPIPTAPHTSAQSGAAELNGGNSC